MTKLTIAKKNEILRGLAMEALGLKDNKDLLQVAGSKYAIDVQFDGEWYPVRIDIVVPKITDDSEAATAVEMAELYANEQAEKAEAKKAKAEAKAKKIARDEKLRAEKRAIKEAKKLEKEGI